MTYISEQLRGNGGEEESSRDTSKAPQQPSGAHLEQWEHQPSGSGGVSIPSMLGCMRLRWILLPEGWPSPVGGVGKPLSQQQDPSSSAFSLPGAASFLQSPSGYVWHGSCWKDQNYYSRKTEKGMKNADILLDTSRIACRKLLSWQALLPELWRVLGVELKAPLFLSRENHHNLFRQHGLILDAGECEG